MMLWRECPGRHETVDERVHDIAMSGEKFATDG